MVALTTSLAGRVRNTNLPKSHSLLPLLEAVVNGLQAIDARLGDDIGQGRLRVKVERSAQEAFDFEPPGPGRDGARGGLIFPRRVKATPRGQGWNIGLSAWELDRSVSGRCVTCVAASPRVTVTDPQRPGLIAR